jgi:hypothetical protein
LTPRRHSYCGDLPVDCEYAGGKSDGTLWDPMRWIPAIRRVQFPLGRVSPARNGADHDYSRDVDPLEKSDCVCQSLQVRVIEPEPGKHDDVRLPFRQFFLVVDSFGAAAVLKFWCHIDERRAGKPVD